MASAWYLHGYMLECSLFGGGFHLGIIRSSARISTFPKYSNFFFYFSCFFKNGFLSVKYEYKLIEKIILAL